MIKIFMADDDPDDTLIFKDAVAAVKPGTEIVCAGNGAELLENLEERVPPPPDYLFLDINMPVKSGHECLKEIKNHEYYKDIKVVILTTSRNCSDINKTYQLGADYYICKPSSMKGYCDALSKLFNHSFPARPSRAEFVIN